MGSIRLKQAISIWISLPDTQVQQLYPAILIFTDLGGYRDAAEMATDCRFKKGQRLYEEDRYPEAYAAFYTAGGCQDAEERPAGPGEGGA